MCSRPTPRLTWGSCTECYQIIEAEKRDSLHSTANSIVNLFQIKVQSPVKSESDSKYSVKNPTHQDGLEVALKKVSERCQEVDGSTLDELPLCPANLFLCLTAFYQSISWEVSSTNKTSPPEKQQTGDLQSQQCLIGGLSVSRRHRDLWTSTQSWKRLWHAGLTERKQSGDDTDAQSHHSRVMFKCSLQVVKKPRLNFTSLK